MQKHYTLHIPEVETKPFQSYYNPRDLRQRKIKFRNYDVRPWALNE
jgi:hypothetical protein